jgi:chromosomal replication initiation ATPase DnaA
MDRYSFATYLVDEFNQEAFTLCHDVANLQAEHRMPLVLVGDPGTGKTHLLYSIIARIRTSSARAGIAYVNANEFPQEVLDLIADPAPVQEAPHAVLLVDQLESFGKNLEVLEQVIGGVIFIADGFWSILTGHF